MKSNKEKIKQAKKLRRQARTRAKVRGTASRPRLCVTRSLRYVSAQIIDDTAGKTLVSANVKELKLKKDAKKSDMSVELGKLIAKKALEKKINEVVFDKGASKYHGRLKVLADSAREAGLKF